MKIDPHVHFRDSEQNYKETIKHGLETAKQEGIDIVFDMPNTFKPILRKEDVVNRLKLVPETEKQRYYLYIGATSDENQLKEAVKIVNSMKEVIGIKMFAGKSTGDLAILREEDQRKVYEILSENNYEGVLTVHCEKEEHMTNNFNPNNPISHAQSRPNIAELESIKDQIKFAIEKNFKGNLHICHVSCKDSLVLIEEARKKIKITCGVTPHHLFWDESKLNESHGLLYKMNPPLRSKEDVDGLRIGLKQDQIDWIETDHAPHTIGEKLYKGYPSGYPSLYLYKKCVEELLPEIGLSNQQIENLTFNNIKKTFKFEVK